MPLTVVLLFVEGHDLGDRDHDSHLVMNICLSGIVKADRGNLELGHRFSQVI